MRLKLRWLMSLVVLIGSLWTVGTVFAQDTREDYALNGVTHKFIYPAGITTLDATKAVLSEALPVFNRLFGMNDLALQIKFWNVPAPSGLLADASPNSDAALAVDCLVNIYQHADNAHIPAFKFTLAHEISHCYQFRTRPDPIAVFGRGVGDPNMWWIEGSAEWLAAKVYPPAGRLSENVRQSLYEDITHPLYDDDYERFWFFQFFGTAFGDEAVIDIIRNIPPDQTLHRAYLEGYGPADYLFGRYGRMLLAKAVPLQWDYATFPDLERLTIGALPGRAQNSSAKLSVKLMAFDVPAPAPEHGIEMKVTGINDGRYSVVLPNGVVLPEGESYLFCGAELSSRLYIALGRGDDPEFDEVKFEFSDVECLPKPPDCAVGVWQMVDATWPTTPDSPPASVDYRDSYLEIRPDGVAKMLFNWEVTAQIPTGEVIITEMRLEGRAGTNMAEQPDGSYQMKTLWTDTPPGTLFVTINGQRQDMTAMLNSFQTGMFGRTGTVPGAVECGGDTLHYWITRPEYAAVTPDSTMHYRFVRRNP